MLAVGRAVALLVVVRRLVVLAREERAVVALLELDRVDAALARGVDQRLRLLELALVVVPDLGDDVRGAVPRDGLAVDDQLAHGAMVLAAVARPQAACSSVTSNDSPSLLGELPADLERRNPPTATRTRPHPFQAASVPANPTSSARSRTSVGLDLARRSSRRPRRLAVRGRLRARSRHASGNVGPPPSQASRSDRRAPSPRRRARERRASCALRPACIVRLRHAASSSSGNERGRRHDERAREPNDRDSRPRPALNGSSSSVNDQSTHVRPAIARAYSVSAYAGSTRAPARNASTTATATSGTATSQRS